MENERLRTKFQLLALDYLVFGGFMCISLAVGIFHAYRSWKNVDKKQDKTENFLMGGRKMPLLPVTLSLLTTFLSGITVLGTPAEIFQRGINGILFYSFYVSSLSSFVFFAVVLLPVLHKLKLTSIFEYLELRFESRLLRRLAAASFLLSTTLFMAVAIYAPAIAFSGVTGVPTWSLILLIGISSTVYTALGGLKAVIWTDTIQAGFMYAGLGTAIVKGTMDAGGVQRVWQVAMDSGRISSLWRLDPTPAQFNSIWISLFSGFFFWLGIYGVNQMSIQRYCALPTLRGARIAAAITAPLFLALSGMSCFMGLIILAYFYDCNPLETGEIRDPDQLVVQFAVKVLSIIPGFPGLFLACMAATTLSTVSTGYSSMAAVVFTDFVLPQLDGQQHRKLSDINATRLNQCLVCAAGVLSMAGAFLAQLMGGIVKASFGVMGSLTSPLVAVYLIGFFDVKAEPNMVKLAYILGMASSAMFWTVKQYEDPYRGYFLPTNTSAYGCSSKEFILRPQITSYDPHYGNPETHWIARLSTYSQALVGTIITVFLSILLSRLHHRLYDSKPRNQKFIYSLTYYGGHLPYVPRNFGSRNFIQRF